MAEPHSGLPGTAGSPRGLWITLHELRSIDGWLSEDPLSLLEAKPVAYAAATRSLGDPWV